MGQQQNNPYGYPVPSRASLLRQQQQQRSRQPQQPIRTNQATDDDDNDIYANGPPRSAIRWQPTARQNHIIVQTESGRKYKLIPHTEEEFDDLDTEQFPTRQPPPHQQSRGPARHFTMPRIYIHWTVYIGLSLFLIIAGMTVFTKVGTMIQSQLDDWSYGRPRTFQTNAVVGHSDSASNPSHFIAMNLNRQVIVIEIPGGDATHAQIYLGPTLVGDGQDLTPVTLSFQDVTKSGKKDMLVHIVDQTLIFLNNGTKFIAPKPGQQVSP